MALLSTGVQFGHVDLPVSQIFLRERSVVATVNIKPVVPGHVMIVPIRHGPTRITDLTDLELQDLWSAARIVNRALEPHFGASSATFVIQDGPDAGQTVKHPHLHVMPRTKGDFDDNDDLYRVLEGKEKLKPVSARVDAISGKVRTPEEMAAEALLFRKLVGYKRLLQVAEECVKEDMAGNDPSHDMQHVYRVRSLAMQIAQEESKSREINLVAVELGALLHDVKDHKYSGSREAGPEAVKSLLEQYCLDTDLIDLVTTIVGGVSYSKEVSRGGYSPNEISSELACVQDADRLDAIGAVGIARCFSFGAIKGRPLDNSIEHFHDKLFKLAGMMKTPTGRRMAEQRTLLMRQFVEEFNAENESRR